MIPPPPLQRPSRGLIEWFLYNPVAANILMLFFVVSGLISVIGMPTEVFPPIDPRLISVRVTYPGATPYEVSDSITRRIEEQVVGIEGVERVASTAAEGYGAVSIEVSEFASIDDVYNEVETAVRGLSDFPPQNAEAPLIRKIKPTPNVLTLVLYGTVPETTLRYWAETIEDELRALPGVALTAIHGIRAYEISIEVSEKTLQRYGLSLQEIHDKIQAFSQDVPAGTVESRQGDILLRVQDKRRTASEFEAIVLRTLPDGSTLRLGDIGTVLDGFEDIGLLSRFNNAPAVFIDVRRSANEDTLAVAKAVKTYLETVRLPAGLNLSLQEDMTINLKDRLSLMLRNGLMGFALVFLILLLFLDLKLAFWVSAAIPVSFLGGLFILSLFGYSLNMISLFAMIVVLGIVVDDGIVMGESIFEAQERMSTNPDAVLEGVQAVRAPVTVGVVTTMAAFGPLIFSTGTLGQIIRVVPAVVVAVLFVSLVEAYFILPAHLAHPTRWSQGLLEGIRHRVAGGLVAFTNKILGPLVKFCMSWRYVSVAGFIGLLIVTIALVQGGVVRFVFFPHIESDSIHITVQMPVGTPFESTESVLSTIEDKVLTLREALEKEAGGLVFESISVRVGALSPVSSGPRAGRGGERGAQFGQIRIQLVPSGLRPFSASQIERMIRARVGTPPEIESLEFRSSLINRDSDIEIELSHLDEAALLQASAFLKKKIAALSGAQEVTESFEKGKEEYVFKLTQEGLAVGLTPAELGRQLRAAYFGLEVQRFQRGRSEVIVYVRYPKEERESLAALGETRIRLPNGAELPLKTVAEPISQRGYSQIKSVNGRRVVRVTADVAREITTPGALIEQIQSTILPEIQAQIPGLTASFEGESRRQKENLASLGRNMSIGLMIIYVILGAQLRSYIQPLIIMSAIPFGIVGAVLGHFLLGYDLTFISLFGVVALGGVVVNDSVVLMDHLNLHHRQGLSLFESALNAIERRFRPVLLTTASTSLGLLPMLLERSLQAQFLIPMVISLAIGILFASCVTLILVPCLVLIAQDIRQLFIRP